MDASEASRAKRAKREPPVQRTLQRAIKGLPPVVARCYPHEYKARLNAKVESLKARLLSATTTNKNNNDTEALPPVSVFESEPEHFRMRATFKVWFEEDGAHYAMFERDGSRMPHEVVDYPMGSPRICALMPRVLAEVNRSEELRRKVDYCTFLTTLATDDVLITLTYNRPIEEAVWGAAARVLLEALGRNVRVVGRSKKVKIVVGAGETVEETLHVPGGRGACRYTQTEGAFTQPNAKVCEQMLGWAYDATRGSEEVDLCELYCGNGCFTVACAPNFRRVVATEISKASVDLASHNVQRNSLTNVTVARAAAEELAAALTGSCRCARLEEAGVHLQDGDYDLHTLLVDPPRAGLDPGCRQLAATAFRRIIYISCNPESLARDVAELSATHCIRRLAAFDQFPYTDHLECGVVLERR